MLKVDEEAAAGKDGPSKRKADNEGDSEASTSSTSHPLKKRRAQVPPRGASDAKDVPIDVSS